MANFFTYEERLTLQKLLKEGLSFKKIAAQLHKDPSTISREVRKYAVEVATGKPGYSFNACKNRFSCKIKPLGEYRKIKRAAQNTKDRRKPERCKKITHFPFQLGQPAHAPERYPGNKRTDKRRKHRRRQAERKHILISSVRKNTADYLQHPANYKCKYNI